MSSVGNAGQGMKGMSSSDWTRIKRLNRAKEYNTAIVTTTGQSDAGTGSNLLTPTEGSIGYTTGGNIITVTATTTNSLSFTIPSGTIGNGISVVFQSSFAGLTAGTIYYIINYAAGPPNTCKLSLTPSGSEVTIFPSAGSATTVSAAPIITGVDSAGNLSFTSTNIPLAVGQAIQFATAIGGLTANTDYFIASITGSSTAGTMKLASDSALTTILNGGAAAPFASPNGVVGTTAGATFYGVFVTDTTFLQCASYTGTPLLNQQVRFNTTIGGLSTSTDYYIADISDIANNRFKISNSPGGAARTDLTPNGTSAGGALSAFYVNGNSDTRYDGKTPTTASATMTTATLTITSKVSGEYLYYDDVNPKLANGQAVTTGTSAPRGLTASTTYYIIGLDTVNKRFQVTSTDGGNIAVGLSAVSPGGTLTYATITYNMTSQFVALAANPGMAILVSGFTNSVNNGTLTVVSTPTVTEVVVAAKSTVAANETSSSASFIVTFIGLNGTNPNLAVGQSFSFTTGPGAMPPVFSFLMISYLSGDASQMQVSIGSKLEINIASTQIYTGYATPMGASSIVTASAGSSGAITVLDASKFFIGQSVVLMSSGGTGLTAGTKYFVKAISGNNLTLCTNENLSTLATNTASQNENIAIYGAGFLTVVVSSYSAGKLALASGATYPITANQAFIPRTTRGGLTAGNIYFINSPTNNAVTLYSRYGATDQTITSDASGSTAIILNTSSIGTASGTVSPANTIALTSPVAVGNPIVFNTAFNGLSAGTTVYYVSTGTSNITVGSDFPGSTAVAVHASSATGTNTPVTATVSGVDGSGNLLVTLSSALVQYIVLRFPRSFGGNGTSSGVLSGTSYYASAAYAVNATSIALSTSRNSSSAMAPLPALSNGTGSVAGSSVTIDGTTSPGTLTLAATPTNIANGAPIIVTSRVGGLVGGITPSSVQVGNGKYTVPSGFGSLFAVGSVVNFSGFTNAANNGPYTITGISGDVVTTTNSASANSVAGTPLMSTMYYTSNYISAPRTLSLTDINGSQVSVANIFTSGNTGSTYGLYSSTSSFVSDETTSMTLTAKMPALTTAIATPASGTTYLTIGMRSSTGTELSLNVDLTTTGSTRNLGYKIGSGNIISISGSSVKTDDVLTLAYTGSDLAILLNGLRLVLLNIRIRGTYTFFSRLTNPPQTLTGAVLGATAITITNTLNNSDWETNQDIAPQMASQAPYGSALGIKAVVGTGRIRRPASSWTDSVAAGAADLYTVAQSTGNGGLPTSGTTLTRTRVCDGSQSSTFYASKSALPIANQFNRLKM